MQQADLFLVFTRPLDVAGFRYMVSGSVASMLYGEPRLTNDIDIILVLDRMDAPRLIAAFPLDAFYCPPEEVLIIETRRPHRGHFNLIHNETGHKADIYMCGDDPLQLWGMSKRRRIDLGDGQGLWIAPPEYVILRKLEFFKEGRSEKHLLDIKGMLEVTGSDLDRDVLKDWVPRLGVADEWSRLGEG